MKQLNSKKEYAEAVVIISLILNGQEKLTLNANEDVFGTKIYKNENFYIEKYEDCIHLEFFPENKIVDLRFKNMKNCEKYCSKYGLILK